MTAPYQICTRCIMDTTRPGYRVRCQRLVQSLHAAGSSVPTFYALPLQERTRRLGIARGGDQAARPRQGLRLHHRRQRRRGFELTSPSKSKELGLRPLAVHVDNGWNSEKAVGNIKRILDPLHIDLSHGGAQLEGIPRAAAGIPARIDARLGNSLRSCDRRGILQCHQRASCAATASAASTFAPREFTCANGRRGISTAATSRASTSNSPASG